MDTACTKCGEPWDVECIHEPEEYGLKLDGTRIVECCACAWHAERGYPLRDRAAIVDALHDVMGDDIDGVVSMLDGVRF
jgi:hypothetical protein